MCFCRYRQPADYHKLAVPKIGRAQACSAPGSVALLLTPAASSPPPAEGRQQTAPTPPTLCAITSQEPLPSRQQSQPASTAQYVELQAGNHLSKGDRSACPKQSAAEPIGRCVITGKDLFQPLLQHEVHQPSCGCIAAICIRSLVNVSWNLEDLSVTGLNRSKGIGAAGATCAAGAVQAVASNTGHAEAGGTGKAGQDKGQGPAKGSLASLGKEFDPKVMLCLHIKTLAI